jgi:hypothetical protein
MPCLHHVAWQLLRFMQKELNNLLYPQGRLRREKYYSLMSLHIFSYEVKLLNEFCRCVYFFYKSQEVSLSFWFMCLGACNSKKNCLNILFTFSISLDLVKYPGEETKFIPVFMLSGCCMWWRYVSWTHADYVLNAIQTYPIRGTHHTHKLEI